MAYRNSTKVIAAMAIVVAASIGTYSASAQNSVTQKMAAQEDGRITSVAIRDLNLGDDSAVEQLDGRLRVAVTNVCGNFAHLTLTENQAIYRCRAEAWKRIAPQRAEAIAQARAPVPQVHIARNSAAPASEVAAWIMVGE